MEKVYENNNILYKILSCLLIALYLIMCLYGSTVFAADDGYYKTFSFDVDDVKYNISANFPIDSNYYVLIRRTYDDNKVGEYGMAISNSPLYYQKEAQYSKACLKTIDNTKIYYVNFDLSDETNLKFSTSDFKNDRDNIGAWDTFDILYSFSDIYASDNADELVFQGASQELAGVTIPEIQSAKEIPQAIIKTMKVVLPVGLVILGIGLVIYLIKSVILRM